MGGVIGGEEGEPVEQEALTVEIFKFHTGECENIGKDTLVIFLIISGFQLPAMHIPGYKPLIRLSTPLDSIRAFEKMHHRL